MFETPILLLAYNRSDNLKKLIEILKKINAKNIYISCDGPKNNLKDQIKCSEVKEIVSSIDWECNLRKNYMKNNNGCKNGVSKGLNWFFSSEDSGIILEDDCIPNKDFFIFCEWALNKYKYENKIAGITGNNFLNNNISIKESIYFSKYANCWGWATWKRVWENFEKDITFWDNYKFSKEWKNFFEDKIEKKFWTKIFNKVRENKIDSWAYPWTLCLWKKNQITITPNVNLVKNTGFNKEATHTNSKFHTFDYDVFDLKEPYTTPKEFNLNIKADKYVFNNHIKGKNYLWPYRIVYILKFLFSDPVSFVKKMLRIIVSQK